MSNIRQLLFRLLLFTALSLMIVMSLLHSTKTSSFTHETVYQMNVLTDTLGTDIQLLSTSNQTRPELTSMLVRSSSHSRSKLTNGRKGTTTSKPKQDRQSSLRFSSEISERRIAAYHKRAEERCVADVANDTHPEGYYCPCLPTQFDGLMNVSSSTHWQWNDVSLVTSDEWMTGGEWQPTGCMARYHMAVIIPFRDRDAQLKALLRHLIPMLRRQFLHFRIFVVEQHSPPVFNKAAMMNIAFMEAAKMFPDMNCVMFQDADTLAEDDRLLMRCDNRPHHYALTLSRWGYRMSYGGQFGGVVTFRPEMFRRINGFPPVFFGWGGEDDNMGARVRRFFRVFRPPIELCRYTTLPHNRIGSNPRNRKRWMMMRLQVLKYRNKTFDGMSTMSYSIHSIERRAFYTYIHANLNVTGLPYPNHTHYSYMKVEGVCPEQYYYRSDELSEITCRFLCDTARESRKSARNLCSGYTHYEISAEDARLGTTVSECKLMSENCQPIRDGNRRAFTFIRQQTDSQTKDSVR